MISERGVGKNMIFTVIYRPLLYYVPVLVDRCGCWHSKNKARKKKKSSKIQKAFLYVLYRYLAPLNNLDEVQICVVLVPEYPAQLVALLRGIQLTHVGADEATLINRGT